MTVSIILNHCGAGITQIYDCYAAAPEQGRALERWAKRLENIVGADGGAGNVVKLR